MKAYGTPQQVVLRGRIVLASVEGQGDSAIARQLEINRKTVTLWRERIEKEGIGSLWKVAKGRGRKPRYGAEKVKAGGDATLQTKPKGMTHWSCRLMAEQQGDRRQAVENTGRSAQCNQHGKKGLERSRVH